MAAEPAPSIDPEIQPFLDAANRGKLLVKHCRACGQCHYYPRAICPLCFSFETEWRESSGEGELYAFTTKKTTDGAQTLAYVTLDDGKVSLLTNVLSDKPQALKIGAKVRVVFRPAPDGTVMPMFEPA